MEEIKMETVSTPATNFCTTTTRNQNSPASLENQNSTAILENHNPPALLDQNQNSTATLENPNSTDLLENQNSTDLLEYHQSNYAAASSKVKLDDPGLINAYLQSFPPGFRFKPTEEELIMHYLLRKIKNEKLYPSQIHVVDIYKESPFYLSANYVAATENEWYFLSPREKKYLNGERPNRAAGNGFWKATGADKSIKCSKSKGEVGVVKTLKYFIGSPKSFTKSSWIMKEYRIKKTRQSKYSEGTMKLDEYVLYKIYKNKKDKSDATNVVGGDEATDQDPPAENFNTGVAQQLNYHQDQGPDELLINGDHINQQNHVDNMREIDISGGQQLQQQVWPIPNPDYLAYYNAVFPNEMSMPSGHQMQGNVFYHENLELLHETLYGQQTAESGHDIAYDYIPQGLPHAVLPGGNAFNNFQALNNEPNISEGFSPAVPPPPVADGSNNVQGFNKEMNIPQMQQQQYKHRVSTTRPSPSSSYHPYHPQK